MAEIRFADTGQALPVSSSVSLLNNFLRDGIRIRHDCGGKAMCGTCRVKILSGAENLSPKGEREIVRLGAVGAVEDERLACQTFCRKTVTLRIREAGKPSGPEDMPNY